MAKLGEGDFIPVTLPGQLMISLVAISGTLFISIGFVVLINLLALSAHEKLALSLIETVQTEHKIRESAAQIIIFIFKINLLTKLGTQNLSHFKKIKLSILVDCLKKETRVLQRLKQFYYQFEK